MKYPYYAFSSECGTFALEAKYAKDLDKYLFYDEKKDIFLDKNGNEVDITGLDILPRTGVLQAEALVNAIYSHGGTSTWVKQGDYEKVLNWPDYIKTKRKNMIVSGREILEEPERIMEIFGVGDVFFKTKNKNYSQIISMEKLLSKEGGFYEALKAHQDDDFILSDVVDIREDKHGMREFRAFVVDGKPVNISRVHDYLVGIVNPDFEYKVLEVMDSVKDTDFPRWLVIDMFEYFDEDGNVQIDVLECNPFVASGTYLYNSVFGRKGYLNHIPMDGSMDPYETIPDEKMKYGPVEMYSKDSTIKGRPSICYELPGGFAADIISFSMFGRPSNGMFLHFETSHNINPLNIGPIDFSTITCDDELDSDGGMDMDEEAKALIKKISEARSIKNESDAEEE
jgi:hypothetical protein